MAELNPFDVLGMDGWGLKSLLPEQVLMLVAERKKILSMIFHPDLTEDEESHQKLVNINAAADALKVPAIFEESLRALVRREDKRIKGVGGAQLTERLDVFSEMLMRFLCSRGGRLRSLPPLCEDSASRIRYPLPGSPDFRDYKCLISDVMPALIGRHMDERNRAAIAPARYELTVRSNGRCSLQRLKRTGPFAVQNLEEEKRRGWTIRKGSQVYQWVGSTELVDLDDAIIGSIDQGAVDRRLYAVAAALQKKKGPQLTDSQELTLFANHKWYRQLMRYPTSKIDLDEAKEGYSFEKIECLLPCYDACLMHGALILSVVKTDQLETPLYRILGTVDGYRVLD